MGFVFVFLDFLDFLDFFFILCFVVWRDKVCRTAITVLPRVVTLNAYAGISTKPNSLEHHSNGRVGQADNIRYYALFNLSITAIQSFFCLFIRTNK